jgi:putative flippase GtrA
MHTFLKSQATSLTATAADFSLTILLVEVIGMWYGWANSLGNLLGASVQFTLGRRWVFKAQDRSPFIQLIKYVIVWIGYGILNSILVVVFTNNTNMHYVVVKAIASVLLSVSYGYGLQKKFVFK